MEKESLLTGCYLLVVLAEPICEDHKEKVIQRVAKGLLSWNTNETECDLKEIENAIEVINKKSKDDSPEILLQHSTEKLAVEVLLSPSVSTLKQCMKNMFLSPTAHKHLIHGGYSFTGTGSWMLDDGLFSFDDFVEILDDNSVHNFLESYSDSMFTLHIHCSPVGQWVTNDLTAQTFSKFIRMELNPNDSPTGVKGAAALLDFLDESLKHLNLDSKMSSTEFIGNIRFNRPTLYIFPSGQGDCSLFGVSGFTMLIDGGFTPFPSFWNFIRHLERLDAVMVTRLSEDNLWGVSSLFKKKILKPIYPQIGYIFCNIAEGIRDSDKMQSDSNELLLSVIGIGQELLGNVKQIGLKPLQCLREPLDCIEPMTLYHKVGLGTLQMYILSPPRDDKILKEFLNHWSSGKESFSLVRTGSASHKRSDVAIPLSNLMSICCLLVWKPCDPNEEITRMLFPGSAPQSRIFEGLNKIEKLDIFSQQKCSQSSIKTKRDVKPSSKQNRFRSVSPVSRVKPYNIRQQSTESEKPKTLEEKDDNRLIQIQNNFKSKPIKQMAVNKSEKKDLTKESVKKVVSNIKTEPKRSKTESVPEKRAVSQSPKKVLRNKKISQTKQNTSKTEENKTNEIKNEKKLSLTLNGIESQNQMVDRVNEKRKSLEMDHEFQNKLLHSDYLKDDMEPDSLESIITDGKISKDSLEVSEDEISTEKFINKPEEEFKAPETVIEEEELKMSITTISSSDISTANIDSKTDNIDDNSVQFERKNTEQTEKFGIHTESQSLDELTEKRDSVSPEKQIISESDTTPVQTEEDSERYKKIDKDIELKEVIAENVIDKKSIDLQNLKQDISILDQTDDDLTKNEFLDTSSEEIEIKDFMKEQIELESESHKKLYSKSNAEDSIESKQIDSKDSKVVCQEQIVEVSENKEVGQLNQSEKSRTETNVSIDLVKEISKDESGPVSGQTEKNEVGDQIKVQKETNKQFIKIDSIETTNDKIKTNGKQISAEFSDKQKEIDSKATSVSDIKAQKLINDSVEDNKQIEVKDLTQEIKETNEKVVTKGMTENQSEVDFNTESLNPNVETIKERIDSIRVDSETGHTIPSTNISQTIETNKKIDLISEEKYEFEFVDKLTLIDSKDMESKEKIIKKTEIIGFDDTIKEKSDDNQNKTTDDNFKQSDECFQISAQVLEKDIKVSENQEMKPLKLEEFKEELEFKDYSEDKTIRDSEYLQQNIEIEETQITIVNETEKLAQRKLSTDHKKDLYKDSSIDPKYSINITDDIKTDTKTTISSSSQMIGKNSKDYIEVRFEEPKADEKTEDSPMTDQIVNDVYLQLKNGKEIKTPSEEELKPKDLAQEIKESEEKDSIFEAELSTTPISQTINQKSVVSENIYPVLSSELEINRPDDSSKETCSKELESKKQINDNNLTKVTTDYIQFTEKSGEVESKSIQMDLSPKLEDEIKSNEKQNLKNDSKIIEIKDQPKNIEELKTDKESIGQDSDKTKFKDILKFSEQKTIETSEQKISTEDKFIESGDKLNTDFKKSDIRTEFGETSQLTKEDSGDLKQSQIIDTKTSEKQNVFETMAMDTEKLLEQKIDEKQGIKDSVESNSKETKILKEIKSSKVLTTDLKEIKQNENLINKSDFQTELNFSQEFKDKDSKDSGMEWKCEESKTVEKQVSCETSDQIRLRKESAKDLINEKESTQPKDIFESSEQKTIETSDSIISFEDKSNKSDKLIKDLTKSDNRTEFGETSQQSLENIKKDSKQTNVTDLGVFSSDDIDFKVTNLEQKSKDKTENEVSLKSNSNQFKEVEEIKSSNISSDKSKDPSVIMSSNKTDNQNKTDSQTEFGFSHEITEKTTKDSDQINSNQPKSGEKQLLSNTSKQDCEESNDFNKKTNKTSLEDIKQQELSKKPIEFSTESSAFVASVTNLPSTHVRHQSQVFDILGSVPSETKISNQSDVEFIPKVMDLKEKESETLTKKSEIKEALNEKSAEIENKICLDSKQKESTQMSVQYIEKVIESRDYPSETQLKTDEQSPITFKDISEDSDQILKDTEKKPKPIITEKIEIKEYSATTSTTTDLSKLSSDKTKSEFQTDFDLSFEVNQKISKDSDQLKYATDVKQISSETLVKEPEKITESVTDSNKIADESDLDNSTLPYEYLKDTKQFDTHLSHSKDQLITKQSIDKSVDNQINIFSSGTVSKAGDSMPSTTIAHTSQLTEKRDLIPPQKQVIHKSEEISTEKELIDSKDNQPETVQDQIGQIGQIVPIGRNENLSIGKSYETEVESVFVANLNQKEDSNKTEYQNISKDLKESEVNDQKRDSIAFKTGQPFEESLFKDISIDSKGSEKISEHKSVKSDSNDSKNLSEDMTKDSVQIESTSLRDDIYKSDVQKEFGFQYEITEKQFKDSVEDKCEELKSDAKHSLTSTKLSESLKDSNEHFVGHYFLDDYAIGTTHQTSNTKQEETKDLAKEIKESEEKFAKELNEKQFDLSFNATKDETKDNQKNSIKTGVESKTGHSLPSAQIRRTSQVVEQPLYEDSDEEDNRPAQMTEQTIVSSTLTADFPELISLSGGTTPSQSAPQSPLDSKSLSRSESVKSREKITIIDTIPEDNDNEKYQTFVTTDATLTGRPSDSSKTDPSKQIESEKSLFESTSQQKDIKSHQKSDFSLIETKDNNKTVDESKPKTVLKESSETEVVIIEAIDSGNKKFNCDQWGQPLSLPIPPESAEAQTKILNKANVMKSNATNAPKVAKQGEKSDGNDSRAVYVELAYVPHHADQHYCNADYFKRVRAKYYVFSGINPHREVFEALIEGKKVWDKQFTTTVIPTHESESLGFWINNNRNLLEEYMIAVAPAADRCTVNLQDYETKCSAYRVEF